MPSSNPAPTHDSPLQTDPTHQPQPSDPPSGQNLQPPQTDSVLAENQEPNEVQEDSEESECGFCLYMKAGGCRDPFTEWEKCVEEGENNNEDIVNKCHDVTKALKDCMEAHQDHYGPILQAEKAAQQEAMREMEEELNVQSDSKPEEEIIQSGLVSEVEEIPNATQSDQKLAF